MLVLDFFPIFVYNKYVLLKYMVWDAYTRYLSMNGWVPQVCTQDLPK